MFEYQQVNRITEQYGKIVPPHETHYNDFFEKITAQNTFLFENFEENKKTLQHSPLSILLTELYFENEIKNRIILLSNYYLPPPKPVKPKLLLRSEMIKCLERNNYKPYCISKATTWNNFSREQIEWFFTHYCPNDAIQYDFSRTHNKYIIHKIYDEQQKGGQLIFDLIKYGVENGCPLKMVA
jgi:hypothetical protein